MSKLNIAGGAIALLAAIVPMQGQTLATGPGDFMVERILALSGVMAPVPPNLPAGVLGGIQAGAIEIHQRLTYNSAKGTMEQLAFVVPGNSPVPFPDPSTAPTADHYVIQVESASVSTSPRAVILSGHVTSNDVATPFGDVTGAGVTLTFGYTTTGAAVQFGPILESVSPLYGLYSDKGAGSLSLTPAPQKCTSGTLIGNYMFQFSGSVQGSYGLWGPYHEGGKFQADGKGNITVVDSGNVSGSVFTDRAFPIAYIVNDDCTGTFSFGGSSFGIQVSRDGKVVNMVSTKPAFVVASGVGRQQ